MVAFLPSQSFLNDSTSPGGCRRQGVRPSSEGAGNQASTQAPAWQPQARRRRRGSQWTKQIQPVTVSGRTVIISRTLALSLEMARQQTQLGWRSGGRRESVTGNGRHPLPPCQSINLVVAYHTNPSPVFPASPLSLPNRPRILGGLGVWHGTWRFSR